MQKTIILLCLMLYITLSSSNCKKKSSPQPAANDTYQPTTAGSEWNYSTTGTTTSGSVNIAYKLTATSTDSAANGKTYRVFTNTAGVNEYYVKTGNDYFRISTFAGFPSPLEFLYLKDNLSAGGNWTEAKNLTIPGIPFAVPVNLSYTIVGNKFDTSFNGNSFKDVIRVRVRPSSTLATVDLDDITYLYAKNVGLIANKVRLKITLASIDVNTETKLGAYTIK
jgi:hypothetical protein